MLISFADTVEKDASVIANEVAPMWVNKNEDA